MIFKESFAFSSLCYKNPLAFPGFDYLWNACTVLHFSLSLLLCAPALTPRWAPPVQEQSLLWRQVKRRMLRYFTVSPHSCTGIPKAFNVSLTRMKKTPLLYIIILPMSIEVKARRMKSSHNSEQVTTVPCTQIHL